MAQLIVDAPFVVETLLNTEYDLDEVLNSSKPTIKMVYNQQRNLSSGRSGGIYIYQVSDATEYEYSARKRDDQIYIVSIDLRFKSRRMMQSNVSHIKQILEVNQTTIEDLDLGDAEYENPFQRIYELRGNDLSNRVNNFHRYIIDVELQILGRIRRTA